MMPFEVRRARCPEQAVKWASEVRGSAFLAGGTSLADLMKLGIAQPRLLIDINRMEGAGEIVEDQRGLHVGALVRNSDLARHPRVLAAWPLLSQAISAGASAQLRNMATVGGNLLQRTRCPYFRDPVFACNKRMPGAGCAARDGVDRSLAVLGVSDACRATHPSDMLVAMVAFGGDVVIIGPDGVRQVRLEAFHRLPGETPHIETALAAGELVTGVRLDAPAHGAAMHYLKVRDRASYEFALASAAVILTVVDGVVTSARIALGGVATVPWRSQAAEDALLGQAPRWPAFRRAAEAAFVDARPGTQNAFKLEVGRRTLVRALEDAVRVS